MTLFLDTCALFKLYHLETDTAEYEAIFAENSISKIWLSDLTKIEFAATLWKKVRTKEITDMQAKQTIAFFESDYTKYEFIAIDQPIVTRSGSLLLKYGQAGLRTQDSIQLSTAIFLKDQADLFVTADKLLKSFFSLEMLPIKV